MTEPPEGWVKAMVVMELEWNKIESRLIKEASKGGGDDDDNDAVFDKNKGGFIGGAQPYIEDVTPPQVAEDFAQRTARPLTTRELRARLGEISTQVDD